MLIPGSVTALEVLLLLHRSPDTYWTPAAAASATGVPVDTVAHDLRQLEQRAIVVRAKDAIAFRYAPSDAEVSTAVNALAEAYARNPADVLRSVLGASR